MEVEDPINKLGGFGRMQIFIIVACYLTSFLNGCPSVQDSFVNYTPKFRCMIPECDQSSSEFQESFMNFTLPLNEKKDGWQECKMYKPLGNTVSSPSAIARGISSNGSSRCSADDFSNSTEIGCEFGFVYDTSVFETSTVMEFDLVCGYRSTLPSLVTSMYTLGLLLGSLICGVVSDKYGRRNSYLLGVITEFLGMFIGAFSVNYVMLIIARLFAGIGMMCLFITVYVIVVEYMPAKYRTSAASSLNVLFALGEVFVGVVAVFVREWRILQLIISVPVILLLAGYWFLPESPRWLENKGKYDELNKTVARVTRMNNVPIPEKIQFSNQDDAGASNKGLVDLIRLPVMRKISFNMFYIWFAVNMVYYGMSQNAGNIAGNIFVNFLSMMLIEVPAYLSVVFFYDRFGHKRMLFAYLIVTTIACMTCGLLPKDSSAMTIMVLSLLGKFGGAGAFGMIFIYSAELYPTEFRSVGMGVCSMSARVSGLFSPLIAGLGVKDGNLPILIFGSISLLSIVCCLFLPETVGRPLPQTTEDCEKFSEEGMFDFLSCKKRSKPDAKSNKEVHFQEKASSVSPKKF